MKVFKFGGASTNSIERIAQVAAIIKNEQPSPLIVIVSAMGKTTNALEKVTDAFFANDKNTALQLFDVVKQQHLTTAKYLLVTQFNACLTQLTDFFTEVEWLLHDKPVREYDYYYDQIVCIGELLSTCIISHYLREVGIANEWIDVRDILRTDANFRDAGIDWDKSAQSVGQFGFASTQQQATVYVTQGFIGATDENESTTLGREGSDYTAAIFANLLNAQSVTIWKDVEGVMNADPKAFPQAQIISQLSCNEVIEMAFYGAQVIHPKTIKPLQNKSIPLYVKCFLDASLPGTVIENKTVKNLPPIYVVKENQVLLHLHSLDFSFVGEQPMIALYEAFGQLKIRPNLVQTGAVSLQICVDDRPEKIDRLAAAVAHLFDVQIERGLSLLTVRNYTEAILQELLQGKHVLLEQRTTVTSQALYQ